MDKHIFLFVILIRALAAMAITNAHYTGIYPTDLIANGGLLGDVLFFSVSGFCLANTSTSFVKWYRRRFVRIYIPTWIITMIYLCLGAYVINSWSSAFRCFIWPTHWHFIASIILLYIPLYFVSRYIVLSFRNYRLIAISLFAIQLVVYLAFYDYSYYHIDTVREPMIEFLFFQAMLLGLHFRWRCDNHGVLDKKISNWELIIGAILLFSYFISKMVFVSCPKAAPFQIVNQLVLWELLYVLFDVLMKLENKLNKIKNSKLWNCISFISNRTLEIYLVQYVIIAHCKYGVFPFNWIFITTIIILSASILHFLSQRVIKIL